MHSAILFSDTNMIPKYFFFTKGVGKHKEQLQSFELALRDAGIQMCNLVAVSSIVPPGCELLTREKGLKMIQPGEITFVVIARNATNEPHRLVASSVGVAIPSGKNQYGYLLNITPTGKPTKQQATTQKTWQQRCWQQPWASNLTQKPHGTNANNSSKPLA